MLSVERAGRRQTKATMHEINSEPVQSGFDAEVASRTLRDSQDQRRFVAQVRSGLADDIERGSPDACANAQTREPRRNRVPLSRD